MITKGISNSMAFSQKLANSSVKQAAQALRRREVLRHKLRPREAHRGFVYSMPMGTHFSA